MNRWTTTLIAGVIALAVAAPALVSPAPALAQAAKTAKGKGKGGANFKRLETALAKLNLTAEQKPKVDAAVKEAKDSAQKIQGETGTPEEKRPKLRQVQKTLREKLSAVLTADQKKQFQEATARKKPGAPGAKGKKPAKPAKTTS